MFYTSHAAIFLGPNMTFVLVFLWIWIGLPVLLCCSPRAYYPPPPFIPINLFAENMVATMAASPTAKSGPKDYQM